MQYPLHSCAAEEGHLWDLLRVGLPAPQVDQAGVTSGNDSWLWVWDARQAHWGSLCGHRD